MKNPNIDIFDDIYNDVFEFIYDELVSVINTYNEHNVKHLNFTDTILNNIMADFILRFSNKLDTYIIGNAYTNVKYGNLYNFKTYLYNNIYKFNSKTNFTKIKLIYDNITKLTKDDIVSFGFKVLDEKKFNMLFDYIECRNIYCFYDKDFMFHIKFDPITNKGSDRHNAINLIVYHNIKSIIHVINQNCANSYKYLNLFNYKIAYYSTQIKYSDISDEYFIDALFDALLYIICSIAIQYHNTKNSTIINNQNVYNELSKYYDLYITIHECNMNVKDELLFYVPNEFYSKKHVLIHDKKLFQLFIYDDVSILLDDDDLNIIKNILKLTNQKILETNTKIKNILA